MAEAEDVITDVARHGTIFVRELWKSRLKAEPRDEGLRLRDVAARLDLLLIAVFGQSFVLRSSEPAAPRTFLTKVFRRDGPLARAALPATDGRSIWLPRQVHPLRELDPVTQYKVMALQQAMRIRRESARLVGAASSPLERALVHLFEADAADGQLSRELPGLHKSLVAFRGAVLEGRPRPSAFPPARRGLEEIVHGILNLEPPLVVRDGGAVLDIAGQLARRFGTTERAFRLGLYEDVWTGAMLACDDGRSAELSAQPGAEEAPSAAPRSVHLPRAPRVRNPAEGEDERKPGAWMVQTAAPHEQVEDPFGLQRPVDRGDAEDSDEMADAFSELAEARTVSSPARPKEVFLSEDSPDRKSRLMAPEAESREDLVLRLPEWDYRAQAYAEDSVAVHVRDGAEGTQAWVDRAMLEHQATVTQVRRRFEMLRAQRVRKPRQVEGDDIDLNAFVDGFASFRAGQALPTELYETRRLAKRDLAVYLLVDVSGSTDAWVAGSKRVIDVEREALLLTAEALQPLGESFAIGAFSGEGPKGVVLRHIKRFSERFSPVVARRIAGLEPEHYTRVGAALRCATNLLLGEPARQRLLVLLSDGKPNDVDRYEGRYGVEDLRQAANEARLQGVSVFCLTVDRQASSYLPAVFGPGQYALLTQPKLLPLVLVDWMSRLLRA